MGTALLAHGVTASKETMLRLGESLARAGFVCLALDFPGHGDSREPAEAGLLGPALVDAGRVLSGGAKDEPTPVDVFVGHSMGAYIGAEEVAAGRLRPRLFVALGAAIEPARLRPARVLLATGRWDPLVGPQRLEKLARTRSDSQRVDVVISPTAEHVLEPFDSRLVAAVVETARDSVGGARVPPSRTWRWRLAGVLSLGLTGLLAAFLIVRPGQIENRWPAAFKGGLGAGAMLAALILGVDPAWTCVVPGGRGWLGVPVCVALAAGASTGLTSVVARAGRLRRNAQHWAHALTVALALLAASVLALAGARFSALLAAVLAGILLFAAGLGAILARGARDSAAAHGAFALLAG